MTEKTIGAGILAGLLPNVCSVLIYTVITIDEVWQFCLVHIVVIVLVAILMRSADKELFTIKTRIAVIIYSVIAIYNFFVGYGYFFRMFHPEYNYEYKFSAGSGFAILYVFVPMCAAVFFIGLVIGKLLTDKNQKNKDKKDS